MFELMDPATFWAPIGTAAVVIFMVARYEWRERDHKKTMDEQRKELANLTKVVVETMKDINVTVERSIENAEKEQQAIQSVVLAFSEMKYAVLETIRGNGS